MFKGVPENITFPEIEKTILEFWEEDNTFQKSLDKTKDSPVYSFYDGPPFATGLPHYGHLLPGTIKDILPRYYTMRGYYVERRFGWDCHGLPVEYEVEKSLGLSGKADIEEFGIDKFNEECRSRVLRYTEEWEATIKKLGRWVDFVNDYKTMDTPYMESIWWVFKQLWDKGLVYEGKKVLPYSIGCTTPLSNFEANLNYKDVQDPAITVKVKWKEKDNRYFLIWTTTPWTLPENLAIAVGEDIEYLIVRDKDNKEEYVLAKPTVSAYYRSEEEYEIVEKLTGKDLEGVRYEPMFPYFKEMSDKNAFQILIADFVETESGTGTVHLAPAYGEDDFIACSKHGIELVDPIDAEGKFTDPVSDYKGMYIKDADPLIIKRLKSENKIVKRETINHSYPFCWRSETPLIYKAISTWFVRVEDIKDNLISVNKEIHWVPEHLKEGRFGKWIENAKDWAISRNRYWGNTLPIWRCDECEATRCIGSIEELEKLSNQTITDIHKHFIDDVTFTCEKCNGTMKRIPEVFDCWFESGSMPYAQAHYPFENEKKFKDTYPADFISEGLDQTRGWFYTLLVLSTSLFKKPAFKNVIVNGLVLAEDGKKMSKRLKNYPDPNYILDTYGADSLRLYMINSSVVKAEDLKFSETGVKDMARSVLLPFWNAYVFFITYANVDDWNPKDYESYKPSAELDCWVLSILQTLLKDIKAYMEDYHLYRVVPAIVGFIDDLTNWYIRRSRRRFWKSTQDDDKISAYYTLYTVLVTFSKVLAPFLPFLSDYIYQVLSEPTSNNGKAESVHLQSYPEAEETLIDKDLEEKMYLVRIVVNLGRSLRRQHEIKIRQPLSEITIVTKNQHYVDVIKTMSSLIMDELNVKKVTFRDDEENIVEYIVKPNFKILGKRLGKQMKEAAKIISGFGLNEVKRLEDGEKVDVLGHDVSIDDLIIERTQKGDLLVMSEQDLTVALNSQLTDELISEGLARDFVNRVQKMRKDANFNVDDKIIISYDSSDKIKAAVDKYADYISDETLSEKVSYKSNIDGFSQEQDIEGDKVNIIISRK